MVDIDLEAFFDRVNHDRLMVRVRQHVDAPDVLKLINRFLKGGVQVNGQKQATTQGVPQGGPLSPVLANVVLDELDWALERQGHRFARYTDDCNIFVKSKRASERLMHNVTRYSTFFVSCLARFASSSPASLMTIESSARPQAGPGQ